MSTRPHRHLLHLLRYATPFQSQIVAATVCSILRTLFDLAPPFLIGVAVDILVQQEASQLACLGIQTVHTQLLIVSLLTILTWGLESLTQYGADQLWRNLAQTLQHELRVDAYGHLQRLEISYFEDRSTGTLLSILNDDINQLERFLDTGARDLIDFFTRVAAVGLSFVILAPGVAWLAMVPIPFILWGALAFQQRLGPRYSEVRDRNAQISARLANNISGIATIKSFTTEAFEQYRVEQESDAYRTSNRKAIALSASFQPLLRFLILLGFVTTLYLGGRAVLAGQLSVGTYGFMVFIVQDLLWPFTELGEIFDEYQRAMASVWRVMKLLDSPIEASAPYPSVSQPSLRGEISFNQITFAYQQYHPVIRNLSLNIPAGATIGIVGATGSGKSTLIKLLLRFYQPQQGDILIDGQDIQTLGLADLRCHIGWVSQDVFLFHGTVTENIGYGSFDASHDQIVQAAKVAEAHDFIQQLPQGYDTVVGERGQKLSGGQRQRIATARTILKNPPILVLDEATSAVDNETEAAIQKSLTKITQNRTTIAIAHRLSTIRHSDCIYVMDKGQLVEQGTHEQLLAQNGIYAKLWRVQSGLEWAEPLITSEQ
ncbi:abc transporter [Leptolyngbya sp. Heron Island J]|uniref:ABC transporter ATP-binding protein n=1 Tax=Leptolyngbya sp. Heron Island J TaxID=1385935 RepID=UPI0003B9AC87|nr:ABC transporter ATP-binding protein [Leptolyngbya sp. Heron Island J]ESA35147.1 abc transporter [Leptolyngbya sp. Heron Island J]